MPDYKIIKKNTRLVQASTNPKEPIAFLQYGDSVELPEDEGDRLVARGIVERLVPEKPPTTAKSKKEDAPN